MEILAAGHRYRLNNLKTGGTTDFQFYKDPEINGGAVAHGPNCQEVIRMLIDRVEELDSQKPYLGNELILAHLRLALAHFEARALIRKVEKGLRIEQLPTASDGHIVFVNSIESTDNA